MGETSGQIKAHIEQQREALGDNLKELQGRAKEMQAKAMEAVDWRMQMQRRPMTMLGLAFGAGLVLSMLAGRRLRSESPRFQAAAGAPPSGARYQKRKLADTLDNITGALIAVTATKIKNFLGDAIPGFHDHYEKVEQHKDAEVRAA